MNSGRSVRPFCTVLAVRGSKKSKKYFLNFTHF
jgi:hypothetical protein